VHSGQEMFSCGSLASRISSGFQVRSDGCMDWGVARCGARRC
jgi:hypothetical protein